MNKGKLLLVGLNALGAMALVFVISVLFSGYQLFFEYRRGVNPDLEANLDNLHFFTREYIKRQWQAMTVEPLPPNDKIPSFYLYASEKDLSELDSELPASGKRQYISGSLRIDRPAFSGQVSFRYRGGLPLHWLYDKKSLRIKLPPYTTFLGHRSFNLVGPSTIETITDLISYDISRELGLLTPDYFPARVYINNRYNGLHFFLSEPDESFLRKNARMPGSIYSGDTFYLPDPFGSDKTGQTEITFAKKDSGILLWKDHRLWEKQSSRNAEQADDRDDIELFIQILGAETAADFLLLFDRFVDKEKFFLFWGIDTLLGSYHHDLFHNHKIYFDPYLGTFEPIQWDLRFWSPRNAKDLVTPPLLERVILNPDLEYQRDLIAFSLLNRFTTENIVERIDIADALIREELSRDPYRQVPDPHFARFGKDKEVPFTIEEYDRAIEHLKQGYIQRHSHLRNLFNDSSALYKLSESNQGARIMTISVSGNSPIRLSVPSLREQYCASSPCIKPRLAGETLELPFDEHIMLYPGRKRITGNALNTTNPGLVKAVGDTMFAPSPLHYQFEISEAILEDFLKVLTVHNAITGAAVTLQRSDELPASDETESVHPWQLPDSIHKDTYVELSGRIEVHSDLIFEKDSTVNILPGTSFRIAPNRSIVVYGRVVANGTPEMPIVFGRLEEDEPWGSLVLQGRSASNSTLDNIIVSGGSVTSQRLIDYPGQINLHGLHGFTLTNCVIKDNAIGDDSLHIAYSKGEVSGCHFENAAFDAVDIDIANVSLSNSTFVDIGNDGLDVMTSSVHASGLQMDKTGDKCLSIGEESRLSLDQSTLKRCTLGIAVKDGSEANIEDVRFVAPGQGIALYRKNDRYSVGGKINGQRISGLAPEDVLADEASINGLTANDFISVTTQP